MEEPSFSIAPFAVSSLSEGHSSPKKTNSQTEGSSPVLRLPSRTVVKCAVASSKFIILGLSSGRLLLFDVFGNSLDQIQAHVGPVSALSLGGGVNADEVVASAGKTRGDIRAAYLFTGAPNARSPPSAMLSAATVSLSTISDSGVVALAVDPGFGKPRFGERVAYADSKGAVRIFSGGWFGGTDHIMEKQASRVDCLIWVNHLLAFATHDVVKVFDTRASRIVCIVAPPGTTAPKPPIHSSHTRKDAEAAFEKEVKEAKNAEPHVKKVSEEDDDDSAPQKRVAANSNQSLQGVGWALRTNIFMMESDDGHISAYGESTVLLYVTWPAGSRIVRIGPHKDTKARQVENDLGFSRKDFPVREIEVIFNLARTSLPSKDINDAYINEESPLIALAPFGEKENVALVGTSSEGLCLHLISEQGVSMKRMLLPHHEIQHADLLTIPGGDPLILIIGHATNAKQTRDKESASVEQQDVVFARALSTAERVKWLLRQNRFSDALQIAQSAPGGSLRRAEVSLDDIGEQFLDSLWQAGDYNRLASVLPETIMATTPYVGFRARDKVLMKRKKRWERWIRTFEVANRLEIIAPIIPTYEPCLDEVTYNHILVELCESSSFVMLDVLKTWPADVFGVSTVTKTIEEKLNSSQREQSKDERESLREGLLMMYGLSGRHDETLNLLLREKSSKVYDYIRSHHLYEAVRSPETISGLYTIDPDAATELLSHAPETVLPPEAVVPILVIVDNPKWTFMYLHAVFRMDSDLAPKYHNYLLKLYVEYGSKGMLSNFLRSSTHYSLDRALEAMGGAKGFEKGHLARERVDILSEMGDLNAAMDILLDELSDSFEAIEFASDHSDGVLWERLIDHARTNADTLAALLDSPAGGKVDPVRLIPLLTSEMRIPHLRDRLHRILVDAALERALREDTAAALHHDASVLMSKLDAIVSFLP